MEEQRPIKIAHVIASLKGGAATVALELASRMTPPQFESIVIAPCDNYEITGSGKFSAVRIFPLPLQSGLKPGVLFKLRSIIKKRKPDIVHCHGHRAGLYGRLLPSGKNRPRMICTYHGFHIANYVKPSRRKLALMWERWAMKRSDQLVFVSREDFKLGTRMLTPDNMEKMSCIRNGIDADRFIKGQSNPISREELGLDESHWVLGFAGRLHRQKNLPSLLRAVEFIQHRIPNMRLALVGEGPLQSELHTMARECGLDDVVRFIPTRSDIERVYPIFDALALPSLWEGLPLVLLEAGAAGIPVLASDAPGCREIVKHEHNGLLFDPSNVEAMAGAIMRYYSNPDFAAQMGAHLQATVLEDFTLERMVRETANLYRRVA
jgi:L-malate glycosyltransferase